MDPKDGDSRMKSAVDESKSASAPFLYKYIDSSGIDITERVSEVKRGFTNDHNSWVTDYQ